MAVNMTEEKIKKEKEPMPPEVTEISDKETAEDSESSEGMGMAELLAQEESESEQAESSEHSLISAKVVSIVDEGALVDIGEKAEALVPRTEFGQTPPFAVGDTIHVVSLSRGPKGGNRRVSWRAARDRMAWEQIEQIYRSKQPVQVKIKAETRGGLIAECENGITGFIPASQIDVRPSRDLKKWKGQTVSVYVAEFDSRKNNLVLSRKLWVSEENEKKKTETMATLKEGDVKQGTVTGITSFGAFVDIGGVEGLLHIGELEWARTNKVSDVLKVGQKVEVKVIKLDLQAEKISLSRKALLPHPWDNVDKRFPVNSIVDGKVVSVTDFGAFVEIAPQVEGLLHASEISWNAFSQKPQEVLKAGEKIKVKVISVNHEQQKISLSLKRTKESPWDRIEQKYPVGSVAKVTVSYLVPFGAFVRLEEGVEGLIHISDFSWAKRVRHPEDVIKVGQELEVRVLEIDSTKEKISFGLKQLKANPYEAYSKGKRVAGAITEVNDSGAVVEIEPELEGFIPRSEISSERFERPSDVLTVGEKVEAKVILVDPKERKINLSIRQLELDLQRAAEKKYSAKNPRPKLGELLDS